LKENRMDRESSQTQSNGLPDMIEGDLPAGLAAPARRALIGAGIFNLEQLAALSEDEVKRLHGIGPTALDQLRRALMMRGLTFTTGK
jgi:predicted flap endonuclease-1-like 5' DNA nuclease